MRIITRRRLREFGEQHPDAITPLDDWYRIVKRAQYRTPQDVKEQFGSASFIGGTVTVFNIAGNKYRLVVNMRYDWQTVFVMHLFTHEEYDEWNKGRR
ncbi:MAG: type II toxin-antitoxin system HigB family toxin [Gemmatimonadales bacterium]|nr:type II toxin-antitoxin system HigB family toxin [Gemmatimonadales bacterium]